MRRYSDRMLELLLRAHRPAIFGRHPEAEPTGGGPSFVERLIRARKRLEAYRARQGAAEAAAQAALETDVSDT